MAKFGGKVGYVSLTETSPGVWTDTATEHEYFGDVLREQKNWSESNQVNDNLTVSHRISIVADNFAFENLQTMRYVIWSGAYWKVRSVEIQRPRIILTLGGVYNGDKA